MEGLRMKPFMQVLDYNYGIKGTEVKFQEAIETYLEEITQEKSACWWQYCSCQIFTAVMHIYDEWGDTYDLLSKLGYLYEKIRKEVEAKATGKLDKSTEVDYLEYYPAEVAERIKVATEEENK